MMTSGSELALELGTSQMQVKKHYDLPQILQYKLCHAVNIKQLHLWPKNQYWYLTKLE